MATGFTIGGVDLEGTYPALGAYPTSSYLADRYPELLAQFKNPQLWGWGYNGSASVGILADGTIISKSSPVISFNAASSWKTLCVLGGQYGGMGGIKADGTLWMWGNAYGLGDGTVVGKSSPVQVANGGTNWRQVSCDTGSSTAAIKTDGTLWVWGYNGWGTLGNNASAGGASGVSTPQQIATGGTNWKQVSVGGQNMFAIKTDNTLWSWGYNGYGALGFGNTTSISYPAQVSGTTWKFIDASTSNSVAIKTDGTLWSCGSNTYGAIGDNTTTDRTIFTQVYGGGTTWKTASAGKRVIAAIKTDGTLWIWGGNTYGQLGDGTTTHRSSPIQTVSGGTNWRTISLGHFTSAAIKTDGTLWGWGKNDWGQLGDTTTTHRSSPVQTSAGGSNWKAVQTGYSTHALRDDSYDFAAASTTGFV